MYWDELLPDVKWGLRNCVCAAHGYRSFEITFKQAPVNLHTQWTECCQVDMTIAEVDEMVAQIVDDLILRWRVCNPVVDARLAKADERMAEGYARRAPQEVYHFEEGDLM